MQASNPYASPTSEASLPTAEEGPFSHLDDPKLKKLYYRSCNIQCLTALWTLGFFVTIGMVIYASREIGSIPLLTAIGICIVQILAIVGTILRTTWGRIFAIIICILTLTRFPLGTLIGIVGLFALFGAPELFGKDRFTHKALKAEFKARKASAKQAKKDAKALKAARS